NPETGESCWQPIKRLFKRTTETLITLKTPMGRKITVTPDHPTCVLKENAWETKPAKNIEVGDRLPILLNFPHTDVPNETLDLIKILANYPNDHRQGVYVRLPKKWQVSEAVRQKLLTIESSPVSRHRYLSEGYFPFEHFLALESLLNISRKELCIYKRSGKANYMKAVIHCNESFARLLGYYLSEGCISQNGNTYKIIFTFASHETEYLEDVKQSLAALGLKPCIEERKSTTIVYATSWLLGWLLSEVWQCGHGASTKQIPSFVFQWYKILQREVLKGLIRGDGSFSNQTRGSHAKITYATTSDRLFRQVVLLLQDLGIVPYTYLRPARSGQIEGRDYEGLPLWQLEISNIENLTALRGIFSEERNALLDEALAKYNGDTHSFPRYKVEDQVASVEVKAIDTKTVEPAFVYDVEVENTHLFITTSGLITHNCVGVPTVGGEVYFDKAYAGNPLVNAMALGLMETEEIIKSGAYGIGNPVLYVGSTTGRDGMGGASFASAELTDASMDDRPAVQVGDPFTEKSLIEACLEAFKTGAVAAAQDMGAAGLTCSTAEMAEKGKVGVLLDLDKIPVRETGMVPYEYLLSESQERMLFVAHKGREQELIDIFHRWGLQAVVAGDVIPEPIVKIMFKGEVAAEMPASALSDDTPIYHHELMAEPPEYAQKAAAWTVDSIPTCDEKGIAGKSWNEVLLTLLDVPTIASKKWIYRQYDHQVQNNTVIFPGGADAAVVRVRPVNGKPADSTIGVAACTDCNPRYVYLNPLEGAKAAVAEAARNLSCVGAEPLAITNNLNFGSPEKPIGYWQLANSCKGISEACRELDTPVTGGNVSLYNETLDSDGKPTPIYPTPVIGMVGR
ncbi:MAG: AIR synthase-related protein, partial [Limnothrix sp.]